MATLSWTMASLRSLLLVTFCAVLLAFGKMLGYGPVLLIVGIAIFAWSISVYWGAITSAVRRDTVVVYEAGSDVEARLCCDLLRRHGIPAQVQPGENQAFRGLMIGTPQVVVLAEQAEEARRLVAEFVPEGPEQET